jgi:hypothetical protein
MRMKEGDLKSDFITYLELLCEFYKQLQRLDAGGRTLQHVFLEGNNAYRETSFRNWLINVDVWGSYLPLNAECYDI